MADGGVAGGVVCEEGLGASEGAGVAGCCAGGVVWSAWTGRGASGRSGEDVSGCDCAGPAEHKTSDRVAAANHLFIANRLPQSCA